MKNLLILLLCLTLSFSVKSNSNNLSNNPNSVEIKVYDYLNDGTPFNSNGEIYHSIEYFESSGISQSQKKQFRYPVNSYGHLVIDHKEYDDLGRVSKDHLSTPVKGVNFSPDGNFAVYNQNTLDQSDALKAGYYYSDNGSDILQDATSFPYESFQYDNVADGGILYSNSAGDVWHNLNKYAFSRSIAGNNELSIAFDNYNHLVNNEAIINDLSNQNVDFQNQIVKQVLKDRDDKFYFNYFDGSGNLLSSSRFGGNSKTASTYLKRNFYHLDIPIEVTSNFLSSVSTWQLFFKLKSNDPDIKFQILELDENYQVTNTSRNQNALFDADHVFQTINKSYLNSAANGNPNVKIIQIRSFLPFWVQYTEQTSYQVTGNRVAGPSVDDSWTIFHNENLYPEKNESLESTELFLWNGSDFNISFSSPNEKIRIDDIISGQMIFDNTVSNFSSNLISSASIYQISLADVPTNQIDWLNNLTTTNIPPSSSYDLATFQIDYSFKFTESEYYFYNDIGDLCYSITPLSIVNKDYAQAYFNKFDSRGNVIYSLDPNTGVPGYGYGYEEYVYSKDNLLRFSQDANQRQNDHFTYYQYDVSGRVIETGEYRPLESGEDDEIMMFESHENVSSPSNPNSTSVFFILENRNDNKGLSESRCFNVIKYHYDVKDNDNPTTRSQNYLLGNLTSTAVYKVGSDINPFEKNWYSYTPEGQIKWTANLKDGSVNHTELVYTYTLNGRIQSTQFIDRDLEKFKHRYVYNEDQFLSKTYSNFENNPERLNAEFFYNYINEVRRIELSDNQQGIDIASNIDGNLKAINNPIDDLSNSDNFEDLLKMHYEYYNGDYNKDANLTNIQSMVNYYDGQSQILLDEQYEGKLKAMGWSNDNPNKAAGYDHEYMYTYNYDNANRLVSSNFGNVSQSNYLTYSQDIKFSENIQYDINGNISSLSRTKANGSSDDYNYAYPFVQTANRYVLITNQNNSADEFGYNYNMNGNVQEIILPTDGSTNFRKILINYDHRSKVSQQTFYQESQFEFTTEDLRIVYHYDDAGYLSKKEYQQHYQLYHQGHPVFWKWYTFQSEEFDKDPLGNVLCKYFNIHEPLPNEPHTIPNSNIESTSKLYYVYANSRIAYFDPKIDNDYYNQTSSFRIEEDTEPEPTPFEGGYLYELRDHQENVRVIFSPDVNGPITNKAQEYYSYGETYLNYSNGINLNKGYMGLYTRHEVLSNLDEFKSRHYNSKFGVWLSIDPQNQFSTPYGIGGIPHIGVDPDGEWLNIALAIVGYYVGGSYNAYKEGRAGYANPFGRLLGCNCGWRGEDFYSEYALGGAMLGYGLGTLGDKLLTPKPGGKANWYIKSKINLSRKLHGKKFGATPHGSYSTSGTYTKPVKSNKSPVIKVKATIQKTYSSVNEYVSSTITSLSASPAFGIFNGVIPLSFSQSIISTVNIVEQFTPHSIYTYTNVFKANNFEQVTNIRSRLPGTPMPRVNTNYGNFRNRNQNFSYNYNVTVNFSSYPKPSSPNKTIAATTYGPKLELLVTANTKAISNTQLNLLKNSNWTVINKSITKYPWWWPF